jgi:hypothetical protein
MSGVAIGQAASLRHHERGDGERYERNEQAPRADLQDFRPPEQRVEKHRDRPIDPDKRQHHRETCYDQPHSDCHRVCSRAGCGELPFRRRRYRRRLPNGATVMAAGRK